ncbi:MAG: SUMF1/EgtB/PvdO family nonheme iron enzyme [Bacteroidia bacterium]|nr:SUMF1/EgtB/PvdO family nonheme iron enzyme [Bacteroidia bacterium]
MNKFFPVFFICLYSLFTKAQTLPEMISVEGDTFMMGDIFKEGLSNETPHKVMVSDFKIAKTETTVAQWKVYCKSQKTSMPKEPRWGWIDNFPITGISWIDAMGYCNWLSTTTGKTYRLPTEAEWEFAARGGKSGHAYKYSGSPNLIDVAWYRESSKGKIHPVAKKNANELGLFDMSGNAWEWCSDWYGLFDLKTISNPQGRKEGRERVSKGCDYNNDSASCRLSHRVPLAPEIKHDGHGFRVVCN